MTVITRETCETLRAEIDALLEIIEEDHGIKLTVGNIRYTETTVQLRVSGGVVDDASGTVETPERAALRSRCELGYDHLTMADLDEPLTINGRTVRIVGFKGRRPRYPYSGVEVDTGRRFKYTTEVVRRAVAVRKAERK